MIEDWQRDPAGVEVHLHGKAGPTREMRQQVEVQSTVTVLDGKRANVKRTVDILKKLRADRTISHDEEQAGRRFQRDFYRAGLETIQAGNLEWVPSAGCRSDVTVACVTARQNIHNALDALGGLRSRMSAIIWACLGLQQSLRELENSDDSERVISRKAITGILIAAVEHLKSHYDCADGKKPVDKWAP